MQDYIPRQIDINEQLPTVVVKQFDNLSRFIHVQIFDNDLPDLPDDEKYFNLENCTARLYIQPKGDDSGMNVEYIDGEVADDERGIVTFLLPSSVTETAGNYEGEIWIYGAESSHPIISTKPFDFVVEKSIRNNTAIEGTSKFTALDNALNAVGDIENNFTAMNQRIDYLSNYVTPEMYGAKGDGVTDDTLAVQNAVNTGKPVMFTKIYMINDTGVIVNANNSLLFGCGTLAKIATNASHYKIVTLNGHGAKIDGLNIVGDKDTHYGDDTEFCHCVAIQGENCQVVNANISNPTGDCIVIGENIDGVSAKNAFVFNCIIKNARRNGISVINSYNFSIENCKIYNTAGTNPQFGIDIEPNRTTQYAIGTISNVVTENNYRGGIQVYDVNNSNLNVKIENCVSYNDGNSESGRAVFDITQANSKGVISYVNCCAHNYNNYGIRVAIDGNNIGDIKFTNISLLNGGNSAAIRLYSTNNATSINPIKVLNYYSLGNATEVTKSGSIDAVVTSVLPVSGFVSGLIVKVPTLSCSAYNLTAVNNVTITFSSAIKQCLISCNGQSSALHASFIVNGYREGTRNVITTLDNGSNQISINASEAERNEITLSLPGVNTFYISVVDFYGSVISIEEEVSGT